ncbi:Basal cell adhesion molecule B-CAM cell surface glycoprotein [Triplophysa tibetana]|uniref:Basal cell adhesion molecule B-CAM cell surface glycoprotein n=1 Tax=Triplophysa tibetana TaxID=1572043 RepID=A0A5A9N0Q0_9TELE|nr:Basal cell adhesion molecule B-CAM cell surface glycoprotein [Triplophysa tibetana]
MERTMLGRFGVCTVLALTLQVCLAAVTVNVIPEVEVIKGEMVKLTCSFTTTEHASSLVVQWFIEIVGVRQRIAYWQSKGDAGIDADTLLSDRLTLGSDMSLTISSVTVEDEMTYYCQVTGGPVGTSEAETVVKVFNAPEKPMISGNNQAITVSHDSVSSSEVGKCTSRNAHPEPRIIWFKDGLPLAGVKDQKEKTFMIPSVVKEASGLTTVTSTLFMRPEKADAKSVFHCTVEYSMPNNQIKEDRSETFSLSLLYPSENVFFKLMNQGPIKEGDDVHMICETDGNPQPEIYFHQMEKKLAASAGKLVLKNVTRNDAGNYKCEAEDFDAEVELVKTLSFSVHYLDLVEVDPKDPLFPSQGDAVELQCKTKSSDGYTLQWKKDTKVLSQNGVLSLQSVSLSDAGVYICVGAVPSVPGLQKQANVTLTVKGKPEIDTPVDVFIAKEGGIITLNCSALGFPSPQFTWTPSGKESVTVMGNNVISRITLEATSAVLKDGVTCEASNELGMDSKKFKVSIKSEPVTDKDGNAANRGNPVFKTADRQQAGSSAVVIAVVVCVLLLLLLVAGLFFLNKKGKLSCGKKNKKDVASGDMKGGIVVEMKSGEKGNEESGLLNKPNADQC